MRMLFVCLAVALTITGNAFAECIDDPRLANQNQTVDNPIMVTPETFIILDKDVIERLGNKLVVCSKEIDFKHLWTQIIKAMANGNQKQALNYLKSYSAKPMPPSDIVKLDTPINLSHSKIKELYQIAGLPQESPDGLVLDFFLLLGGKANEHCVISEFMSASAPMPSVLDSTSHKKYDKVNDRGEYTHYIDTRDENYEKMEKRFGAAGFEIRKLK